MPRGGGAAPRRAVPGVRGCSPAPQSRPEPPPPPPAWLLFRSIRLRLIKNNRSLTLALLPAGWCVVNGDIVSLDPRLLFLSFCPLKNDSASSD